MPATSLCRRRSSLPALRGSTACTGTKPARVHPHPPGDHLDAARQWEDTYFTPMGNVPLRPVNPLTAGLPNWTINLENSSQQVIASTTTDANGNYSFTNVPAGTYTVAEVQQTGWTQFAPLTGTYAVTVTETRSFPASTSGTSRTRRHRPTPDQSSRRAIWATPMPRSASATLIRRSPPTPITTRSPTASAWRRPAWSSTNTRRHRLDADREPGRIPERRHPGQRRKWQHRHPVLPDLGLAAICLR